eukprot:Rmarinus@m.7936
MRSRNCLVFVLSLLFYIAGARLPPRCHTPILFGFGGLDDAKLLASRCDDDATLQMYEVANGVVVQDEMLAPWPELVPTTTYAQLGMTSIVIDHHTRLILRIFHQDEPSRDSRIQDHQFLFSGLMEWDAFAPLTATFIEGSEFLEAGETLTGAVASLDATEGDVEVAVGVVSEKDGHVVYIMQLSHRGGYEGSFRLKVASGGVRLRSDWIGTLVNSRGVLLRSDAEAGGDVYYFTVGESAQPAVRLTFGDRGRFDTIVLSDAPDGVVVSSCSEEETRLEWLPLDSSLGAVVHHLEDVNCPFARGPLTTEEFTFRDLFVAGDGVLVDVVAVPDRFWGAVSHARGDQPSSLLLSDPLLMNDMPSPSRKLLASYGTPILTISGSSPWTEDTSYYVYLTPYRGHASDYGVNWCLIQNTVSTGTCTVPGGMNLWT